MRGSAAGKRNLLNAGHILLLIVCMTLAAMPAHAQETSVLQIRVRDAGTDKPLGNASVALRTQPSTPLAQIVSDTGGLVRFAHVKREAIHVSVRRIGSVPFDTTVSMMGEAAVTITVRLQPLSNLLAAVRVSAEDQCPVGYGRLTRDAAFASVVLASVDSQFSAPLTDRVLWRVIEERRLTDKSGNELERYQQEWMAAEPPALKGLSRDTLESLGYSWLSDTRWFFALPHPATLARREFERLHCFRSTAANADSTREIQFVPSMRRVPQQLAGRVVFGGEPITIQRMDLFYKGVPGQFGDSIAKASIRFEPTSGGSVRLNSWRVSTPARLPYDTVQSVLAPEFRPTRPLDARVEYTVAFRVDSEAVQAHPGAEPFRVLKREVVSHCRRLSLAQCLTHGITTVRNARRASDSIGVATAAGYFAAACRTGPLAVGRPVVAIGDSARVQLPPHALALGDASGYLGAFWDSSRIIPAEHRTVLLGQVQLESCSRLVELLVDDPFLATPGVSRAHLADWACAGGEAAVCLWQALAQRKAWEVEPLGARPSVSIEQLLRRACFLRAARACRLMSAGSPSFDAARFRISRLRGDGSTEAAARLLRSRAEAFLESSPTSRSDLSAGVSAALRTRMSKWSRDVEMVERPGGVLLTLHASHPDRITENLFRPGTEEIADSLGAFLRTRSDITALVVVHSDSAWSPAGSRTKMFQDRQIRRSNEQRGEAWVNQLIRAGADRKQVQIHLAGDSEPLFSNLTRLGQQLNRRVEIAVRVDQRRVR